MKPILLLHGQYPLLTKNFKAFRIFVGWFSFVGYQFCEWPILWKQRITFLFKSWCLQRFRCSQSKSSSTNIAPKISGEWCRRWRDRWVKEEQEEECHHIYFFLPNSVGFYNLPHSSTVDSSLILLKLTDQQRLLNGMQFLSACLEVGLLS